MDWLQLLTASGAVGAIGIAIATWIRVRPQMKKAEIEGEAALWVRIKELEARLDASSERHERQEERHAGEMSGLKAELRLIRHDRNNLKMAVTFMVTRIKDVEDPEMRNIAAQAEEMMLRGEQILAAERGAMMGGGT